MDNTNKELIEMEEKKALTERIVNALNMLPPEEMKNAVFYVEGKASNYKPKVPLAMA